MIEAAPTISNPVSTARAADPSVRAMTFAAYTFSRRGTNVSQLPREPVLYSAPIDEAASRYALSMAITTRISPQPGRSR